ncbi:metallophosphoesterase [Kamptonema formosum]|uniref:metallophosphoesterase n=1 Tax=Kamptonema formosum TaxID=331992 RepID=UPI00034B94C8|nr:metallophosphoesterase [Oscillatoria sp. PCC 10802]
MFIDKSTLQTLLYNLIMIALDLAALSIVRRHKPGRVARAILFPLALAGIVAAVALKIGLFSLFGFLRLLSYGVFLHGFIVLTGIALIWRREFRGVAIACAVAAFLLGAIAIDAFFIEPYWLEVSRIQLKSPKLEHPLKIAVIADFQTDVWGEYQRDSLRKAVAEKADIMLLAGDYLQLANSQLREVLRQQFNAFLKEINFSAPLGVYAVGGDVEKHIEPQNWPQNFAGLPVTVFPETTTVKLPELCVTGLTLGASRNRELRVAECAGFHIALGHAPDFALSDIRADLLVAGHTHGGQVRLPFIGPIITFSKVPRQWAAGVTEFPGNRTLVVSRGIGMERGYAPRLRFLCRPELVFIEMLPVE